ncbi:hypothetical protein Trydic_g17544 [Trypoxylus dichotomus]
MNREKYFCTLDVSQAYLHMEVDEDTAMLQAISTHLAVEMTAGKIQPPGAADEYRWKARTAIEKAKQKQIPQNICKAEQRSLEELMTDKNIKILPADKGNATIKEITIHEHDKLVSFDVTSLFTNVPTVAALAIVKNRLSRDTKLDERTSLSVEAIIELLSTCVNTTYFQVDNKLYHMNLAW